MSSYFVEVLSKTGQEYIIPAYESGLENKFSIDYEEDMRIYREHIKANMTYDVSILTNGWMGSVFGNIRSECSQDGTNKFDQLYSDTDTITSASETIDAWNRSWAAYSD
jgi:hypothetical protein